MRYECGLCGKDAEASGAFPCKECGNRYCSQCCAYQE